ncbi:MAG: toxin-antitoxin system HicB family antitoxin [Desulfobacteraceae bacterium]|nr:toxin-antitoxin system HicB family antitoxin [Desulfobacteraceae bacterium]
MNDNTKLKQLTLRISENLHREFKVNAAKQGQSMGEIAIELIRKYLKKNSGPL